MKRITLSLQSPYVGLRPFSEREAVLFFGREQHVRNVLGKLEGQQRFIAVLGASGSGKSSLVRAGVVPALHRGALTSAGPSWNVCIFTPGDAPLANLAKELVKQPGWVDSEQPADAVASLSAALARSPLALTELYRQKAEAFGGQALLLVVDQFEEIFRYRQRNIDEAESFINLLLRSASEDVPIYVVLTMRSDFLGNLVAFFGLPEAVNRGVYLTPRLGPDQLKSVIASPLALVGGEIDPVLVSKLVNTLEGEDELPIMEHALLRMWNRAREAGRSSIQVEDFETVCAPHDGSLPSDDVWPVLSDQAKLSYAIDNHASEIYVTLSSQQQRIARQVFLALVERRDGREVRRPQALKQLIEVVGEPERENLIAVIDAFRAEQVGFLRPPKGTALDNEIVIDISHESLFRQWHLFQRWLSEEELDAAEFKEWQHRTARHKEGGGWLDEHDCERAHRWRARMNERTNPLVWGQRYGGPVTYAEVDEYIERSTDRAEQTKAKKERVEREAKEAETRRLELEAQVQREAAERAEAERLNAEKDKKQAQEYAAASRRKTRIAQVSFVIAAVFFLVAAGVAWWANQQKNRAEMMAHDATAGELAAKAESLFKDSTDQSALLALAAWQMSPIAKSQALIRRAMGEYPVQRILRGHENVVTSAQFAPDGKTVVTASLDQTARLWDVPSGKELHVLRGHKDVVTSAQFAPDGKTVVTASLDRTARLWDVPSGKELHVLRGHEYMVTSAQFAPDGKQVVTVSFDTTARLWDVASGKELHVLSGHKANVMSAQFAPDGKTVVTASEDQTARLWDVPSGKELHVLRGHKDNVTSAQFAPDGKQVVTVSLDRTARLWDVPSGKELHVLRGHEYMVTSAQFAPDGKQVVTASSDQTARLWDVPSGKELHVLSGHEYMVTSAQFAPDGKQVVTASQDKTARLWDVASGKELHVLRDHKDVVTSAQFAPDGKQVVTASQDKTARLWDLASGKELHVLRGHEAAVMSAQFAPDGKQVVTASQDKTARLWDVASGKELHVLRGHKDVVTSAQFAPDGKQVVTASQDKTARLWDLASGEELHVLRGHEAAVMSAQFAPDGKQVVTASQDKTARLWDVASGKELHVLRGHEAEVMSAQFAPDGKQVVTASEDATARLWDVASGKELHVLRGHKAAVMSAQFAPDGKQVVTASGGSVASGKQDQTARLWDVASGKELHVLRGHEAEVMSAQFAPDGKTVVTASLDQTARLWDLASGKELHVLRGHKDKVWRAQFAPDGKQVVTASGGYYWSDKQDKTARLWDVASGTELHVLHGHENRVTSAQFAPDGKTVVTASEDATARLWRCEVCRPIEELAAVLRKNIGRDLTDDERRRYGVPDRTFTPKQ